MKKRREKIKKFLGQLNDKKERKEKITNETKLK